MLLGNKPVKLIVAAEPAQTAGWETPVKVGFAFTLRAIALLVEVDEVTQVRLVVITQVTLPTVIPASEYVDPIPTLEPSFFH